MITSAAISRRDNGGSGVINTYNTASGAEDPDDEAIRFFQSLEAQAAKDPNSPLHLLTRSWMQDASTRPTDTGH
jgi:hypothetical protein